MIKEHAFLSILPGVVQNVPAAATFQRGERRRAAKLSHRANDGAVSAVLRSPGLEVLDRILSLRTALPYLYGFVPVEGLCWQVLPIIITKTINKKIPATTTNKQHKNKQES